MNIDQKIEKIMQSYLQGIPKKKIDVNGNGQGMRNFLAGKRPGRPKIEEMYQNVLTYEKNQILTKLTPIKPDFSATFSEKKAIILHYVAKGVPKSKIDIVGGGCSVRSLGYGNPVSKSKMDQMYVNLIAFLENGQSVKLTYASTEEQFRAKIESLENIASGLLDRIICMECAMAEMQKKIGVKERKKVKNKVMGLPLSLKTDVVRGRKYQRWYATYKENGKSYKIYIGKDVTKAIDKIAAWMKKNNKGEQLCVR